MNGSPSYYANRVKTFILSTSVGLTYHRPLLPPSSAFRLPSSTTRTSKVLSGNQAVNPSHRPKNPTMAFQNGTSSTCLEQPIELQDVSNYISKPQNAQIATSSNTGGLRLSDTKGAQESDPIENLPSPTTQSAAKLEQWNHPRSNFFKTSAAFWSFVVMGSNDAAYGALIPYVSLSYF